MKMENCEVRKFLLKIDSHLHTQTHLQAKAIIQ
jgi:hypothetical protein